MIEVEPTLRVLEGSKTKGSKAVPIGNELDQSVLDPFDRHRQGVNIRDLRDLTDHMLPKFRSNSDFVTTLDGVDVSSEYYDDTLTPITRMNVGSLDGNSINPEVNLRVGQRLSHETEDRDLGQTNVYDHPNSFTFVDLEPEKPFDYNFERSLIYSQIPRSIPSNKSKIVVSYKGSDGSNTIVSYENSSYIDFKIKHIPKQLGSMVSRIAYDYSRRTVYIPFENISGVKNLDASVIASLLPEISNGALEATVLDGPTSTVDSTVTSVDYIINSFGPETKTFIFTNNSSNAYTLEFTNSFIFENPGNYEFSYNSALNKISISVLFISAQTINFSNLQSYLDANNLNLTVVVPPPFTLTVSPPQPQVFTLNPAVGGTTYLLSSDRVEYVIPRNSFNFAEELIFKNRLEDLDSRIDITRTRETLELCYNSSIIRSSVGVMKDGSGMSELIVEGFNAYEINYQPTKISNSFFDDSFNLQHRALMNGITSTSIYLTEGKQELNPSLTSKLDPWVDISDDREQMFRNKLTNNTELENVLISNADRSAIGPDDLPRLRRIWDSNNAKEWDIIASVGFIRDNNSNVDSIVYGGLLRS